ncbi:putative zinc-binding oxidoreductase protein [Seiridium unicorne]|uniref:Zinc-binding oxidoreductase protein n=1 Tax=Seiridium unicorne TaxID=138068 RepID=A0ABR2VAY2_9PEZI
MAPTNASAQITAARAHPLKVQESPYPTVGEGEIIVKVGAAAINPTDWMIQTLGENLFPWLQYPLTIGSDVAGTVVEVASDVTKVKVGDRVLGLNGGFESRNGGFQEYAVLQAKIISKIPESLSFADASVLPLGLGTAASGLFQKDYLGLDYPRVDAKPNGKTLLVWAGASSVGSNAIQLAVAAGYEVFTTASPKNFDYCKKLGASQVFDYHSKNLTQELLDAFKGKTSAGAFGIHQGIGDTIFEVVAKSEGSKFVAATFPIPENKPEGVEAKTVWGGSLKDNEVGPIIFDEFLPAALAKGTYKAVPEPEVVGNGLEHVQDGWDKLKQGGISAKKLVVTL